MTRRGSSPSTATSARVSTRSAGSTRSATTAREDVLMAEIEGPGRCSRPNSDPIRMDVQLELVLADPHVVAGLEAGGAQGGDDADLVEAALEVGERLFVGEVVALEEQLDAAAERRGSRRRPRARPSSRPRRPGGRRGARPRTRRGLARGAGARRGDSGSSARIAGAARPARRRWPRRPRARRARRRRAARAIPDQPPTSSGGSRSRLERTTSSGSRSRPAP